MTSDEKAGGAAVFELLNLDEPGCQNPAVAGSKAAILAKLRQAGFEVPPGVVVPANLVEGDTGELPAELVKAFSALPDLLGSGLLAVRSSNTAEDGDQTSFAGQFETFLNVDSDGLVEAVLRCLRSGQGRRVEAYAGQSNPGSMAVLIQPMVPAEAAGVAFTVDPVSGRKRTVIEAVEGLGDRLVSGLTTPERWTVEDEVMVAPTDPAVLDAMQASAIADLAARVEDHLGRPQDIEWAIHGESLTLLQARPVTALSIEGAEPIPILIEVPPGYWVRAAFHEPVPISPFGWVILRRQILNVVPSVFAELGVLMHRVEASSIGGWIYNRTVPLGAPAPRGDRSPERPPPRWLLKALFRLHPGIRRRISAARAAITVDLPLRVIRRWYEEWRPQHQQDIERALATDLASLSDELLVAELDHRLDIIGRPAHAMVGFAWWIITYELARVCEELLGWGTARALGLLEGLSTTSTEPARQLARLTDLARSKPAVARLLSNIDELTSYRLTEVDGEFAQAFREYVHSNGHRAVRYDVTDPTLAETPHVLLRLIADQLEADYSPEQVAEETRRRRNLFREEARSLLVNQTEAARERFERALARAAEAYPAWEDRVWWTQSVQTALMRYLGLEMGRRLVARGQVPRSDDVFFLDADEVRAALLDGADRREMARVAKGRRAWALSHPGPFSYGDPPAGDPPFDLLPGPARLVNEAMLWGLNHFFGNPASANQGQVTGTAASAGSYTGPVRVVLNEHQFNKIRRGDVVVCPTTSPVWSIVFPNLGALVTDAGGILSHPAIIAREYRIPAVVDTGNATSILKDGQQVTVDGNAGTVSVLTTSTPET